MYLSIILIPLVGSIFAGLFGRKLGAQGSQFITTFGLIVTCLLSFTAFYEVGLNQSSVSVDLFSWIDSEYFLVKWGFTFDSLTVSMLIPIVFISSLVHMYSIGYMGADPHTQRFFSYLSAFTFCMLLLVCGDNLLVLFVGWEGVGVCSYLLISFWFTRIAATKSAIQAIVTNKVGDWGMSIALFAIIFVFGNLDFSNLFSLAPYINTDILTFICLCILIGVMAKSAQLGLHAWLPTAMEGPTPVSALIHSATMVTAGIFLMIRTSPLLEYSSTALIVITCLGSLSAFVFASIGLVQNDLKRIIAYSTASQLGYLGAVCGLSQYNIAFYHIINHAFFKALLFLAAGSVIHAMADEQDVRRMGGLAKLLPFTFVVMFIAALSNIAFPFLSGFYSKEIIILSGYGQYTFQGSFAYWLTTLAAFFTSIYTTRLLYLTFFSIPNGTRNNYENTHEAPFFMAIPLGILAVLSVIFGYLSKDLFIGMGSDFFGNAVFIHPNNIILIDAEFAIPLFIKLLPSILTICGFIGTLLFYEFVPNILVEIKLSKFGRTLYTFLNQKYFFDLVYSRIVAFILNLGYLTHKTIDRGTLELVGPTGLTNLFSNTSKTIASADSGYIPNLALYIIMSVITLTASILYLDDARLLLVFISSLFLISSRHFTIKTNSPHFPNP
jgi:NADH-ubiquinone oxidoreductase chain 5